MVERASHLLAKRWRWLRPLARRVVAAYDGKPLPRSIALTKFILSDLGFSRALEKHEVHVVHPLINVPTMNPIAVANTWRLPSICTIKELADLLSITVSELNWFADLKLFEYKRNRGALRHYRYRPVTKRFGRIRLIEAPKPRLKVIQTLILSTILNNVPPHTAAHGFRRGRSIKTFAEPHTDKMAVLKIDLSDFFPSISIARVQSLFRALGYPELVADTLAGLCSNATPLDVWDSPKVDSPAKNIRQVRWLYANPHLPQGAPTSPTLANLCAYRLDCRLSALAESVGAVYTRYADDLAFSGDDSFARVAKRFQIHVCATAMEEGFRVHHRKTRIMRRGVRQRIAGLVVNKHLNLARNDIDRLKAILTNCIRFGAHTQNRSEQDDFRAHLYGRVAFVESINPRKGSKLRQLLEQVEW
ncbi:reverse transcriptase family protein [Bythopirellula polymerisocia]|nr:reverse transcriptase family protein [Bythopirellula polymerisocia]